MTDSEYQTWLFDPANRNYRVQLWELYSASGEIVRVGTDDYPVKLTGKQIPAAPAPFADYILQDGQPSIDIRLDEPVGYGSLKIADTLQKGWKNLDFDGQYAISYFGDLRWDFVDFETTGIALIESVNDDGNRQLTFNLTDFGDKLEQPVQTNINDDGEHKLLIISGGFNIKPQLIDDFNLIYRYNDGAGVTMTALRDRDDTVDITAAIQIDTPSAGLFTVNSGHNPAGEFRFDADRAGVDTAAEIAQFIATRSGLGTILTKNFGASQQPPQHVVIRDDTTINQIIMQIMAGVGGFHRLTNIGELELIVPSTNNPVRLTEDEITSGIPQTGSIAKTNTVSVNYAPNASPLNDFSSDATETAKKLYGDDYKNLSITAAPTTSGAETIITLDTFLVNATDALVRANTEAVKLTSSRKIRTFRVNHINNILNIGTGLAIEHEDYTGLGYIIRIAPDSGGYSSEIEVVI